MNKNTDKDIDKDIIMDTKEKNIKLIVNEKKEGTRENENENKSSERNITGENDIVNDNENDNDNENENNKIIQTLQDTKTDIDIDTETNNVINNLDLNDIILTRYLYIKDEVKYSILISLLLKREFDEVLFWIDEFYISGFQEELWNFLFVIYYDFYASCNPKIEKYMIKLYKKWREDRSILYLYNIIKNLYNKQTDAFVFKVRMCMKQLNSNKKTNSITIYNKRRIQKKDIEYKKILKTIDKKYHNLFISFMNENTYNIAYHIHSLLHKQRENNRREDNDKEDNAIKEYTGLEDVNLMKKIPVDTIRNMMNERDMTKITKIDKGNKTKEIKRIIFKNDMYPDLNHIYIASLRHKTIVPNNLINNRNIFIRFEKKPYNKKMDDTVYSNQTIKEMRMYEIPDEVGFFQLKRYNYEYQILQKEILQHWQFYTFECPLWRERYDLFGGWFDDNKNLQFEDKELEKRFYQLYNYEFEKQDRTTINKSLKELNWQEIEDDEVIVPYVYEREQEQM